MKTFKQLFEASKVNEDLTENIQAYLKKKFKGDKQYEQLKKAAKKDVDNIPDFLDHIYNILGEKEVDNLSKKYKKDLDELAQDMLK